MLDITNLGTNASLNAKINEVKGEIPSITYLATTIALTEYNTKINETEKKVADHNHDKCITTPEFNKFTGEIFTLRLKWANLASKSDIANLINKIFW